MSRWMKVALTAVGFVIILIVAASFLVNANTFRTLLESQMTTALGRPVKLGSLSFSPFTGSLVTNDLTIGDDPAFSTAPFLSAKQLRIGIQMMPLIFSRKLVVQSFAAEAPQIHLVSGPNGTWNFSSLGRNAASRTGNPQQESAFPNLSVGQISVHGGRAVIEYLPAQGSPRIYDHVNFSIRQFSFANRFPFVLSARLPGDGEVSINGLAGPVDEQNAAMTKFDARVAVKHLNPVAAGFLDPSVGVSLVADINTHSASDGQTLNSSGTIRLEKLQIVKSGSPMPNPVNLVYNVTQNLKDESGQLHSADVRTGAVAIHIDGDYRLVPKNPLLNMKLGGQGLPIDQLQELMKSAGVKLPNGSVLKGGTLSVSLSITGPANNLVITGPVAIDNTRLVGFNLGSKISGLAALGGIKTGDTTEIQKLRLDLRAANGGIATDNVYALMPAVGEATGSGTVSPAGALNYNLVVKVTTAQGLGKAGVGLLSKLNGMAGSTAQTAAVSGVPMRVTGTATNPVITADVKGLMKRNASTLFGNARKNNPGALLKGLFGGKK